MHIFLIFPNLKSGDVVKMKKVLSILILSCFIFGSLYAAPKKIPSPQMEPIEVDVVEATSEGGIRFVIDPRFEVLGIICRLAQIPEFTAYYTGEGSYTESIKIHYGKHSEHKAVLEAKALNAKGISAAALVSLAYHIKPDFSGVIVDFNPLPESLDKDWEKIKTKDIYKFVQLIHDFAVDSKYARICQLDRGNMINHIGYFVKYFDQYHQEIIKNYITNDPNEVEDIITVSVVAPCYYYSNRITDPNGKTKIYTSCFPQCNSIDLTNQYVVSHLLKSTDAMWDNVYEHYKEFVTSIIYKQFDKETADKEAKNLIESLSSKNLANFLSSFLLLHFLQDPIYIKGCEKDETPVTYDLVYGLFEKTFDGEYFAKGIKVFDEYFENRDKYPTLESYSQKICDYVNSLPTE